MLNSWLEKKLKGHNPGLPEDVRLSLIVEAYPAALEQVQAQLERVVDVEVGRTAFRFIEVAAPAFLAERIAELPGVKLVSYNMVKKIFPLPRIGQLTIVDDPLMGKVEIDNIICPKERLGLDMLLPFSPLRFAKHHGPLGDVEIIPTIRSREVILDIPTVLTGRGVKIAVLDTGWAPILPIVRGKAFSTCLTDPGTLDGHSHGSWCTSAAGGSRDPSLLGTCLGVASECDLMHVKVLHGIFGFGLSMDIIKGMELAVQEGAHVLSMSLGAEESQGSEQEDPECIVVNELAEKGIFVVIAAGNSGPDAWTIGAPGCASGAITVGSVSMTDYSQPAWFSSRGPQTRNNPDGDVKPDVLAPGGGRANSEDTPDEVLMSGATGWAQGMYLGYKDVHGCMHGTSQATPAVAGLVACLLEGGRISTPADFKRICAAKGHAKSPDDGWGCVKISWFG